MRPEPFEQLTRFGRMLAELVSEKLPPASTIVDKRFDIIDFKVDSYEIKSQSSPNYYLFLKLNVHNQELYQREESVDTIRSFVEEGLFDLNTLRMSGTDKPTLEQAIPWYVSSIMRYMYHYLDGGSPFDFECDEWLDFVEKLKAQFANRGAGSLVGVPLANSSREGRHLVQDGAGCVSIRNLTPDERCRIWRAYKDIMSLDDFYSYTSWVVFNRDHKPSITAPSRVYNLITAMRLLAVGRIGLVAPVRYVPVNHLLSITSFGGAIQAGALSVQIEDWHKGYWDIESMDLDDLFRSPQAVANVERTVKSIESDHLKQFKVPLRKFNESYSRQTLEDEIVDLATCLESSLCYGGVRYIKSSIKRRGANLLQHILPHNYSSRMLESLYKIRCEVVHSGHKFSDAQTRPLLLGKAARDFMFECRGIVKLILNRYVSILGAGVNLQAFNKTLD